MDILKSLQWRYATKKFDATKTLTNKQINTLKEAFNLTATSYGLQPIKMLAIQMNKIIHTQQLITQQLITQQLITQRLIIQQLIIQQLIT